MRQIEGGKRKARGRARDTSSATIDNVDVVVIDVSICAAASACVAASVVASSATDT